MTFTIPVIDIFAGPGGLGEGFSSFESNLKHHPFHILISVEKEHFAHATLELRSFYRQFRELPVPDDYYLYLQKKITKDELYERWPEQAAKAREEAKLAELGTADNEQVNTWIGERIRKYPDTECALIGGPPCQAYSVIGRSRMRSSEEQKKKFDKDPRHFLYIEYLKMLVKYRPAVFIMENVKGILSARVGEQKIFDRIVADLKNPGIPMCEETATGEPSEQYHIYSLVVDRGSPERLRPQDFIIKSEDYGIPQTRHRVILLGIRGDFKIQPRTLKPHGKFITVEDVLSDLPPLRSGLSKRNGPLADSWEQWQDVICSVFDQDWYKSLGEGSPLDGSEELKGAVDVALAGLRKNATTGTEYNNAQVKPTAWPEWYYDRRINGVCNHVARTHIRGDLHRYLFASCFAKVNSSSPTMQSFPKSLLPDHKNVQQTEVSDDFDDRFRVQVSGRPATTITAHISKDGHYCIHYDPSQCRSLTVREAARLQTFPDNYYFEGPRTAQYLQVGNAVPPLLARQIAAVVYNVFEQIHALR
jgi:DNA (cytosine-5)-methyltransferase 1